MEWVYLALWSASLAAIGWFIGYEHGARFMGRLWGPVLREQWKRIHGFECPVRLSGDDE